MPLFFFLEQADVLKRVGWSLSVKLKLCQSEDPVDTAGGTFGHLKTHEEEISTPLKLG